MSIIDPTKFATPGMVIVLEDCRDKINCLEITDEDIAGMD